MSMIKCPECGKEMSDRAASCPNCGCPIEEIKSKWGEIEAEREEKIRFKEEEKKAKEVAAEIKKKQQEEARNTVTPAMKKKRIIIGVAMAVVVVIIGICAWYFGVKVPQEKSYQAYLALVQIYNDGVQKYNETINQYNDKAKEVIGANDSFEDVINMAQALIDCGDTPYEGTKITNLNNSVKDARNNKKPTPELKEVISTIQVDSNMEKASKLSIDVEIETLDAELATYTSDIAAINSDADAMVVPDYSSYIDILTAQSKELEDSYAIQKQILAPKEEWVITRLERVSDIANVAPVTEENDPNGNLNKAGGYTSTVYFSTSLLGTENLTGNALIEKGTDAGGAIETYKTVEDAEARNTYLAAFDGGILASGSHMVLGTMVVRTSNDLKASQQETLRNAIVAEMTSLN